MPAEGPQFHGQAGRLHELKKKEKMHEKEGTKEEATAAQQKSMGTLPCSAALPGVPCLLGHRRPAMSPSLRMKAIWHRNAASSGTLK